MSNFHTLSEGREGSILIPKAAVYWFKDTSAKGDGDVVAISHLIEVSTDGTSLTSIPLSYSDKEPTDRKIHSLLKTADKNGSNRVNAEWQSAFQEVLQTDSSGLPGLGYQLFNTSYAEQLSNGKFIKKNMLIARPDEDGNTIEPLSTIYPGDKIFCHGIDVRPCLNLRADLEGRSRWTLSLDMGMPAPSDHDSALSKSDYSKVRGYVEEFKTERSGSYSPTAIDKLLLEYTTGEAKLRRCCLFWERSMSLLRIISK